MIPVPSVPAILQEMLSPTGWNFKPLGYGGLVRHDLEIRQCEFKIAKSEFELSPNLFEEISKYIPSGWIQANLTPTISNWEVIRYGPGGKFKIHTDTRVSEDQIGTLLIYPAVSDLPQPFVGGDLLFHDSDSTGSSVLEKIEPSTFQTWMGVVIPLGKRHQCTSVLSGHRYVLKGQIKVPGGERVSRGSFKIKPPVQRLVNLTCRSLDKEIERLEKELYNLKLYTVYNKLFDELSGMVGSDEGLILLEGAYPPGTNVSNLTGLDAQVAFDFQELGYEMEVLSSVYQLRNSFYLKIEEDNEQAIETIPIRPTITPGNDLNYKDEYNDEGYDIVLEATGWMLKIYRTESSMSWS